MEPSRDEDEISRMVQILLQIRMDRIKDTIFRFALCCLPLALALRHWDIVLEPIVTQLLTECTFFLVRPPGSQIHVRRVVVTCYHLLRRMRRAISCGLGLGSK